MSDFTTEAADIDPEVDAPDEVEEELPEEGPDEESDQPEDGASAGDPDEPTFTVKVDGQDIEVRQSELLAGYQRQADYTRKTQALADQRKDLGDAQALLAALQRNPAQTLAVLAQAYGVGVATRDDEDNQDEFLTAEEQRIKNLEAWQRAELDRQREAQIDWTIENLHTQYGEFNDDELFAFAVQRNVMDLETALRSMLYERDKTATAKQALAKRSEKRSAGAVANGGSRNGGKPPVDDVEINSVEDAWAYAKKVLNA